ncbi:MAG: TIGR04053 family radical SAM/SPASM domain-containing protein [Archaeoglobus sp.]|nr:TIGR04053 family radical SAM/SPASM domain-containing protein [Archaeoglobus sp.]
MNPAHDNAFDLSKRPFIIFWELTRACKLACKHCRAKAQRERHPNELSLEEAKRVIEQIKDFGRPFPLVVITGGDPLLREDVFEIVKYGVDNGLRMAMAFSGTDLATPEVLDSLKDVGISRIAISIDGSNEKIHDGFRGVKGTFSESMKILKNARKAGISTQINTTVTKFNLHDLANVAKLAMDNKVTLWDVFFVVPTGRAKAEYMPSSQEFEDVLNWLYDVSKSGLNVKSSAATHLRRIELQRDAGIKPKVSELYFELLDQIEVSGGVSDGDSGGGGGESRVVAGGHGRSLADGIRRMTGITDGRGMLFISHVGEVYPSGFLPLVAGNVRKESLKEIYNSSEIFKDLKNPNKLKGKCGKCEFRKICGGSRARAYALTGDYLQQEPRCIYIPR